MDFFVVSVHEYMYCMMRLCHEVILMSILLSMLFAGENPEDVVEAGEDD